jgi:hypothetical protein
MSYQTFVDACLRGDALLEDVDDWIDRWHDADDGATTLDTFLGLSADEGALFAERPESLRFIVAARRAKRSVAEVLEGRDGFALAARATDASAASGVLSWLRETGRI